MRALLASYAALGALGMGMVAWDLGEDARALTGETSAARAPIAAIGGAVLARRAWDKVRALGRGETLAVTGECPKCQESVYAFVPTRGQKRGRAREKGECHVCGRKIVLDVEFERTESSLWKVTGQGKIFLVSETSDFFDDV